MQNLTINGLKALIVTTLVLGVAWAFQAGVVKADDPPANESGQVAAETEGLGLSDASDNSIDIVSPDVKRGQAIFVEPFNDPLGDWTSNWFYQNSNAENYYVASGNCDPNTRGNQPEGLWISDNRGCGTLLTASPVRIDFSNNFGDAAVSFALDQFTCVSGVTFRVYDKDGAMVVSEALPIDCFNWTHYDWSLGNGISAFEYSFTGSQVEGNTGIDNVTIVTEVSRCTTELNLSYAGGNLSIDLTIGTTEAAELNLYLAAVNSVFPLVTGIPLPVIDPLFAIPTISFPLPSIGGVVALVTMTTPSEGIICADWDIVNTGSPLSKETGVLKELRNSLQGVDGLISSR